MSGMQLRRARCGQCGANRLMNVSQTKGRAADAVSATWHRAELLANDDLYLMAHGDFISFTGGTLRPGDAIQGLRADPHRSYDLVMQHVKDGGTLPDLICVARDASAPAIVLDGNQRAAVNAELATPRPFRIILGLSPRMKEWRFFPQQYA